MFTPKTNKLRTPKPTETNKVGPWGLKTEPRYILKEPDNIQSSKRIRILMKCRTSRVNMDLVFKEVKKQIQALQIFVRFSFHPEKIMHISILYKFTLQSRQTSM